MDNLLHPAAIWFIIGFILFLLEFAIPGLILFFFGIGAWIVAILLLFLDVSLNIQLVVFLVTSVVSVLLLRKWMKKILWARKYSSDSIDDEFIGKTATAETAIAPGQNGKVSFKGSSWSARSEDVIIQGESVTIIGNESILLIVKSTKAL
jgi:membrane protein implicated in regulation of membrane protease activity